MEDAYVAETDMEGMRGWSLFAVLDGHAGKVVALHSAETLAAVCAKLVAPVKHSPRGCMDGLRRAFLVVSHDCTCTGMIKISSGVDHVPGAR